MGRNRKHGSAVRFVPAVKAVLICMLLGGSAIGYVYQKNQIFDLGKQIQQRERRLAELRDNNAKLQKMLQTLQSTMYLAERVKKLNLGLVQPAQSQILTIMEVPAAALPEAPAELEQPGGRIAALK